MKLKMAPTGHEIDLSWGRLTLIWLNGETGSTGERMIHLIGSAIPHEAPLGFVRRGPHGTVALFLAEPMQ